MDQMVYQTQRWLNKIYGNDPRYNHIEENGKTGWNTIYALTRALQIELGIEQTANTFGPATRNLYGKNPLRRNDGEKNNKYGILQGALWCKGYSTGHYYSEGIVNGFSTVFDEKVENAVKKFKTDAGLIDPDGIVTINIMAALLSMDAFKLLTLYGGDANIRAFQQELNRKHEAYIGIMPCDGIYGRNTNKALLYALQATEGLPVGTANGNFGVTTRTCCPALPYQGKEKNYSGRTYTAAEIEQFIKIFNFGLYVNGFGNGNFSDGYNQSIVKQFQKHYALSQTGIGSLETWLSVMVSCGDVSRPAKACDCATILTKEKAKTLADNGYEVVGRYLSGTIVGGASKALSRSEIKIIFDAGLRFFPIFQASARAESYFTIEQGRTDAIAAEKAASSYGIPASSIIYFAVDFDALDYQVTNSIIPYFKSVSENIGAKYKVGIYGARNICSRVAKAGYSVSSFVGDMSVGFSGNLGFKIPDDWAFDQFTTVRIGSGDGVIEIDKDGYSGHDRGVSSILPEKDEDHDDGLHNETASPTVFINRRKLRIPVYSKKVKGGSGHYSHSCGGDILGYIEPNEFYTRYRTGFSHKNWDGKKLWITDGDAVHRVCFRNSKGNITIGYIQENLSAEDYNKKESSLADQHPFHRYNYSPYFEDLYDNGVEPITGCYTFDVQKPLPYYNEDGKFLGILPANSKLFLSFLKEKETNSWGGLQNPWLMWFDKKFLEGDTDFSPLDSGKGAFVSLGYEYGSLGADRAIW